MAPTRSWLVGREAGSAEENTRRIAATLTSITRQDRCRSFHPRKDDTIS
jgi:hypothetical protein